ncbi:MAG TPA: hypothetical protein VJ761_21380 [Ktedonobacteraceae bacterium]|nr:hypothetical protein [Ktedonobacteraceae bacterium]
MIRIYFALPSYKKPRPLEARCAHLLLAVLILVFCLSLVPAQHAFAYSIGKPSPAPTLQVDLGFQDTYRIGFWTPVFVTVNNANNAGFSGMLSVSTYAGTPRTSNNASAYWNYEEPVSLRGNQQKQFTLNVPFYTGVGVRGITATANLLDARGKLVATQTSPHGYEVQPGDLFIGTLSDPNANFNPLGNASLPNQSSSPTLSALDATTMPTMESMLENFDAIVLEDFDTSSLNAAQLATLQTWVNQGGVLIEIGGTQWHSTLSALPPGLAPVIANGTSSVAAGTDLLPVGSPAIETYNSKIVKDTLPTSLDISTGTLRPQSSSSSEVLLASGGTPLIVQQRQGQGVIDYLAFDPTQAPLADWIGTPVLWKVLLLHALGDKFLISGTAPNFYGGPGQLLTRGGVLSIVAPRTLLGPWILVVLLLGYLLILGPVRMLLVRRLPRLQRQRRGWLIILSGIVVFSLLAYGLAFYARGSALIDNTVSLISLDADGSTGHITTYHGIFVPGKGDFTLHIPGASVAQPVPNALLANSNSSILDDNASASIVSGPGGTDLKLMNIGPWTFHPVVSEQDERLQGGLVAHLTLQNNRLVGTITNTLNTSLSDVYVLFASGSVAIGQLAAGSTQQISQPLNGALLRPGQSLADQLAESGGLSASYFPYAQNKQPQSDFQQHMALLAALSGTGFSFSPCKGPCNMHAITSKGSIFITGGTVPNPAAINPPEPLLLPGTSATLIGWADSSLPGIDDVTINGSQPGGQHEKLVQMPLTINVGASSPASTASAGSISGRLVDIESFDAQLARPGIYTMGHGYLTFEFSLPALSNLQAQGLTITQPDLLDSSPPGSPGSSSHLQARLYNWQKGTWDSIALNSELLSTSNMSAYIGPGGRVLMQVSGASGFQGNVYFGVPTLSLNG